MYWKGRSKFCLVCTRALARIYEWDCWVAPHTYELILCFRCQLWLVPWQKRERVREREGGREGEKDRMLAPFFFHIWFDVCLWGGQLCRRVLCLRLWMLDDQWATISCGAGTWANKEYWKSKTASIPLYIPWEGFGLRRATDSCIRSRASQTDGYSSWTNGTDSVIRLSIKRSSALIQVSSVTA